MDSNKTHLNPGSCTFFVHKKYFFETGESDSTMKRKRKRKCATTDKLTLMLYHALWAKLELKKTHVLEVMKYIRKCMGVKLWSKNKAIELIDDRYYDFIRNGGIDSIMNHGKYVYLDCQKNNRDDLLGENETMPSFTVFYSFSSSEKEKINFCFKFNGDSFFELEIPINKSKVSERSIKEKNFINTNDKNLINELIRHKCIAMKYYQIISTVIYGNDTSFNKSLPTAYKLIKDYLDSKSLSKEKFHCDRFFEMNDPNGNGYIYIISKDRKSYVLRSDYSLNHDFGLRGSGDKSNCFYVFGRKTVFLDVCCIGDINYESDLNGLNKKFKSKDNERRYIYLEEHFENKCAVLWRSDFSHQRAVLYPLTGVVKEKHTIHHHR
ncbi:hypothetical protein [Marinomonas arenicola]|uniref:Uncharacterized protein n=1 Tax=Marinomonas arenicola TaxID=569601 RepID=A0ABU9G8N2_9GAMM